jgi:hypothetical protein
MKTFAGMPNFKYRPQYARAVDIYLKSIAVAAAVFQSDLAEEGAAEGRKPKVRLVLVRANVGLSRGADASTTAAAVVDSLP